MRVAAPIEEEQRLTALGEVGDDRVLQTRSEDGGLALGPLDLEVDEVDLRQRTPFDALAELEQTIAAAASVVVALDRRRGRAEHRGTRSVAGAHDRQVARVVA